jgi:hypothetical protein
VEARKPHNAIGPCDEHAHEFETHYTESGRQTVTIRCAGRIIGAIQGKANRTGDNRWTPVAGDPLTGELPPMDDKRFPTAYRDVAIAWIEDRE